MTKLSVLVPCCNVEKYVEECLHSIQNQTFSDFEVICLNDGSKDGTLALLQQFTIADSRFVVIDKPNSGYGDTMNLGLENAKGDYVGIVESDDFIEPEMFEKLVTLAEKNALDIARGCYFVYQDGKDSPKTFPKVQKDKVFRPLDDPLVFYQAPAIWSAIYRRDWLNEHNIRFLPTPGASYQDTSFAFKTYFKCRRFMMVSDCFLHYRQHANNSVKSSGKVFSVCDEWDEIIRYAKLDLQGFAIARRFIADVREGTYFWNYNRLTDQAQLEFLQRWAKDLKQLRAQGLDKPIKLRLRIRSWFIQNCPSLFHSYREYRQNLKSR